MLGFLGINWGVFTGEPVTSPPTCIVVVYVLDEQGAPIAGAKVNAELADIAYVTADYIVMRDTDGCHGVRTDAQGRAALTLIWSSEYENNGAYKISIYTRIDSISFNFVVPDLATVNAVPPSAASFETLASNYYR